MTPMHPLWLLFAACTAASLPILVALCTCYAKVSVVLGVIRNALGTQQVPSAMVTMALSLAVTTYTMSGVFTETVATLTRIQPAVLTRIPTAADIEPLRAAIGPWRSFLERHTGRREILVLSDSGSGGEVPLRVLVPAFVLTELKASFLMGFLLLLPFLVIDMIVANILVGIGMYMLSPQVVSLPLKLILFVTADGWLLLTKSLIAGYQV